MVVVQNARANVQVSLLAKAARARPINLFTAKSSESLYMKYLGSPAFTHSQQDKIGVLITNLGTPDAPKKNELRRYLKEFLSDPRVVEIPRLLWWMILNLV
ncbi:MAG: hypothetical protein ACI965_000895, partial [Paraglaciecola sp.]